MELLVTILLVLGAIVLVKLALNIAAGLLRGLSVLAPVLIPLILLFVFFT
jgi:hypothetical protein